jgi:hypothetical protein
MPSNRKSTLNKQEVELKNRSQFSKEFAYNSSSPEFIPKPLNGSYQFLRMERDPSKLNMSEDSPFFENVGNAMEEYFLEIDNSQDEMFSIVKNEYLFVKETIESVVKHSKVG